MPDEREVEIGRFTRRGMLRGAAAGGLALPVLAACGGDEATNGNGAASGNGGENGEANGGGGAAAGPLTTTAEVPVGGGTILADEQVVVTQPTEGTFEAFTAVCTHRQCTVGSIEDGAIKCPCHGSMFSVEDGSVLGGPAPSPLAKVEITVDGDQINRA